jgi:carbon-monoxide dehydrogenase large subunit
MGAVSIGEAIRRKEDNRLITGRGRYVADLDFPRQVHAVVLRATHAHAEIRSIAADAARGMPGVLAVLTGRELSEDGIGPLPCDMRIVGAVVCRDGSRPIVPERPALAINTVRHVGDPVALVIAESVAQAQDAAEAVEVDYAPLPAVADALAAVEPGAPQIWPQAPGNLCLDWALGDEIRTAEAFRRAAHITRLKLYNNRLVANSLETRGAIGLYDPGDEQYTLYTPTQGAHLIRGLIAETVLGIPENHLRVVTDDVGGGFGMKMYLYPEHVLVLWAAKRVGRPVKWIGERSESFMSDTQGRDQHTEAELAVDGDGRVIALRVANHANLGAYLSTLAPIIPTAGGTRALTGGYDIPTAFVHVRGVFTNTISIDAYRGAGRPESIYIIERLMDRAARELGIDPAEFRRRNFVRSEQMPYRTALGQVYDSGEFERNMRDALELADRSGFAARRAESERRGKLRGLGISYYVEPCGGGRDQMAEVRFDPAGNVTVYIGSQSNGQGHETAYAQLVSANLGVAFERIRVIQGDTDRVGYGRGTSGSRSMPIGGTALHLACEKIVAKGKKIAAHLLEVGEADVEYTTGAYRIVGTDRSISFAEVVRSAYIPSKVPSGTDLGMDEIAHFNATAITFPNGCHLCEVEIDRDTGITRVDRYSVVDDFGKVINPLLVEGQVHGGIAQGIGQALLENCVYDDTGQLVTGSFMDYGMPRADDLPNFGFKTNEVLCRTNPLGVKGCGEAGTIGATPAVINAILDALAPFGITHVDMPAAPAKIWRLIQQSEIGQS